MLVTIHPDLDDKFRAEVGRRFGAGRGALSIAIKQAIELWLKAREKP